MSRIFSNPVPQYGYNILLGLDQFVNTILLGDPDDSFSGRCGRAVASGRAKWWVIPLQITLDWLFLNLFNEANHCANAIEPEEALEKELWRWYYKD